MNAKRQEFTLQEYPYIIAAHASEHGLLVLHLSLILNIKGS